MQAVQLVGCGVIGAALAVLLVSVCFWLAVRVGGVICCCGGVRPGAGGGADLLAVPVGMVSAGTVPAGGVPASRLALAVLHPGQFCRLPEGSDSPPNGSEKQV